MSARSQFIYTDKRDEANPVRKPRAWNIENGIRCRTTIVNRTQLYSLLSLETVRSVIARIKPIRRAKSNGIREDTWQWGDVMDLLKKLEDELEKETR